MGWFFGYSVSFGDCIYVLVSIFRGSLVVGFRVEKFIYFLDEDIVD